MKCLEVFLKFGVLVDIRDKEGWMFFYVVVCGGDIRVVIFFIRNGVSVKVYMREGFIFVEIVMDNKDKKMV